MTTVFSVSGIAFNNSSAFVLEAQSQEPANTTGATPVTDTVVISNQAHFQQTPIYPTIISGTSGQFQIPYGAEVQIRIPGSNEFLSPGSYTSGFNLRRDGSYSFTPNSPANSQYSLTGRYTLRISGTEHNFDVISSTSQLTEEQFNNSINDLDSPMYGTRERARTRLVGFLNICSLDILETSIRRLQEVRNNPPSLEASRRIDQLLRPELFEARFRREAIYNVYHRIRYANILVAAGIFNAEDHPEGLLGNMNNIPEDFAQQIRRVDLQIRVDLAESAQTPPNSLRILGEPGSHWTVRMRVAGNPNTKPEDILTIIDNAERVMETRYGEFYVFLVGRVNLGLGISEYLP